MNNPLLDSVLSRCAALRRGNQLLRDAELRRLGCLQRQIYEDSIELARLRDGVRLTIASDARTRDWARLERMIATASSVAMFAAAGTALTLAIELLAVGSRP